MAITVFGGIWLIFLAYAFIKKNDESIVFMTLLATIFQCNSVIMLSESQGVGPLIITSIVFIVRYILKDFRKIHLKTNVYTIACFMLMTSILISLFVNHESFIGEKLLLLIQMMIYIICFIFMRRVGVNIENNKIRQMIINIIYIVLAIGILQFLILKGIIPKLKIFSILIYNDTWDPTNAYYSIKNLRLFSSFKEPSYCAAFLVGAFYYVCYNYKKIRYSFFVITIILIEIILTMSTTAYISFAIVGLIFLIYGRRLNLLVYLIPLSIIGLFFAIASGKMDSVIFNKMSGGSAAERTMWNIKAIEAFKSSPIFGVGYKNSRASSFILSILSELGIIGFLSFMLIFVKNLVFIWNKKYNVNDFGSVWIYISVVICQFIACPDLDFCVFWMAMNVMGLTDLALYRKRWIETGGINYDAISICNNGQL